MMMKVIKRRLQCLRDGWRKTKKCFYGFFLLKPLVILYKTASTLQNKAAYNNASFLSVEKRYKPINIIYARNNAVTDIHNNLFIKSLSIFYLLLACCLQCLFWTVFNTLKAEDTFCPVFPFPGVICDIYIHRAGFFAFTTGNTFAFVAFYT